MTGMTILEDFSVRADASSRFGKDNRWAGFWSVGLMWDFKKEEFFEDYDWLTNAQLTFSTGTSGNSSISNYEHLALVTGSSNYLGENTDKGTVADALSNASFRDSASVSISANSANTRVSKLTPLKATNRSPKTNLQQSDKVESPSATKVESSPINILNGGNTINHQ